MKITTIIAASLLTILAACVTPQTTVAPVSGRDLKPPRSASFVVRTTEQTEFGSDRAYNDRALSLLKALLGERLKSMGYVVQEPGSGAALQVDIEVTALKSGSQAARLIIGFGAGRAVLTFIGSFRDSQGREIAQFHGGDSNTGTAHPFQSDSDIATFAASESVEQIEKFLASGGVIEEKKPRSSGRPTG